MVSALVTSAFSCLHSLGALSGIDGRGGGGGGGGIFEHAQQKRQWHPIPHLASIPCVMVKLPFAAFPGKGSLILHPQSVKIASTCSPVFSGAQYCSHPLYVNNLLIKVTRYCMQMHCLWSGARLLMKKKSVLLFSDQRSRTPIIIVPAAETSVINILNAQDFLEGFK